MIQPKRWIDFLVQPCHAKEESNIKETQVLVTQATWVVRMARYFGSDNPFCYKGSSTVHILTRPILFATRSNTLGEKVSLVCATELGKTQNNALPCPTLPTL